MFGLSAFRSIRRIVRKAYYRFFTDLRLVSRTDFPEMLELWRLPVESPPDAAPQCVTLVSTIQRGHDAAPRFGTGLYWLTTMSGDKLDCWGVAWTNAPMLVAERLEIARDGAIRLGRVTEGISGVMPRPRAN